MKVVILAGGFGTRLSEYTNKIPKPMVKIGKYPIIHHIINLYLSYGYDDFIIAGGYKYKSILNYFKNVKIRNTNIKIINTGIKSLTATRIFKLKKYLSDETFMLTYGDGLSDINLHKLYNFHKKNRKLITLTAVHPPARFGELKLKGNLVKSFKEKPQLNEGWINGGFFVVDPNFFNFLNKNNNEMLEREPIQKATKAKKVAAYRHLGFWYCMDTSRDKKVLEKLYKEKKKIWSS